MYHVEKKNETKGLKVQVQKGRYNFKTTETPFQI